MLTESKIDKSLLKDVIQKKFGISVVNFTLVPKWEAARGYIIESSNHKSFFLKIYWDDKTTDSAFRFADDLFSRAGIVNIAHPIPTSQGDRKSTRLNSSHGYISYAVFCLKKKKQIKI